MRNALPLRFGDDLGIVGIEDGSELDEEVQVRARLDRLNPGSVYVVRATPAAATASSEEIGGALDACLDKASR